MTLPRWDDMTDLDKGAALLHIHKRRWEGVAYAISDYPTEYFDDPALVALGRESACVHTTGLIEAADVLEDVASAEWDRLYNLALDADRARMQARLAARDSGEG